MGTATSRLFINALPFSLEEEDLEAAIYDVLSAYGTVKTVRLIFEGGSLRPKGLCFVEMSSSHEVDNVIDALDGLTIAGTCLEVRKAIPSLLSDSVSISSQVVA